MTRRHDNKEQNNNVTNNRVLPSVLTGQQPQPTTSSSGFNLESKGSNASSGFAEDEVTTNVHNSKSGLLPPIESTGAWQQIAPHKSNELVRQEKSTELYQQRLPAPVKSTTRQKLDTLERTCLLDKPRPNMLPPITSCDGFPDHINLPMQKSMVMKNQHHMVSATHTDLARGLATIKAGAVESSSSRKRAKTHTIVRSCDLTRGDSWELLKAEKIRCVELSKYEEKLDAERRKQNKGAVVKKHKKRHDKDKTTTGTTATNRPVGRRVKHRETTQNKPVDKDETSEV